MGLKLKQINKVEHDLNNLEIPKGNGLSLSDLQNTSKKINIHNYINNKTADISNAYIIDTETFNYNSSIRTIQLYDTKEKKIVVFVNGDVKDQYNIINDKDLKKYGFNVIFSIWGNEKEMIISFFEYIKSNPKTIIGHNFAHFDIGILDTLKSHYKIKGFHVNEYSVGGNKGIRRVAFSYSVTDNPTEMWYKDAERYNIIDTLLIAQSLNIGGSLKQLSKDTRFKKKDVDWKIFENEVLGYDSILYGIYDVIAIPDILNNLMAMWSDALNELKIKFKQSQRIPEHVLMKGAGAIAEAYLNNLMDGGVSLESKDHLTKYFGGVCRAWNTNLILATEKKKIRYLDFTSFYPFSVRKQKVFDVLNGSCIRHSNKNFKEVEDDYDNFLYSSVFEVVAKEKTRVIIEGELEKNKNDHYGVGYLRSFDKDKRIADLEHQFIFVVLNRGQSIKLTKTELEITKTLYPQSNIKISKVIDGIVPTSDEISEKFIQLYTTRKKLKDEGNDANVGYKVLLNASYGKLAESKGKYFNLACASAITGYCRAILMKTISYAKGLGLEVIYSDTDSLYVYGDENKIKEVQHHANKYNEHPLLFGTDNLKDEGEDIVAFWGIKRKRYLKVIRKNNKNIVVIKGENGNSDIGWRDDLFRLSCITNGSTSIEDIKNNIQKSKFNLKIPKTEDEDFSKFELMCKDVYRNYRDTFLRDIIPVKSFCKITMMINIHFKKSTTYESGIYYGKIVEAWQKATEKKAYIGCFFSINRDYSFREKDANEFDKWSIEYTAYASKDDHIPLTYATQYNSILDKKINLDTIRLKTRDGINLSEFPNDDDKKAVTFKIMSLKRSSQSSRVIDIFGTAYIFRLHIPEDLDVSKVKLLKNKGNDKKVYSNATLFLTGQFRIESALRINKTKMFIKNRDVFSIYRFISDLGCFAQKLVLDLLNKTTQAKTSGRICQPVELSNFPRFTFITQADVYQPVSKEYAKEIHMASFDSTFHNASVNHFWNFKLLEYCELNVYHKKMSAENKMKRFSMTKFEQDTFKHEQNEGEYRSEIKFKLKRNYYETLSYVFALSNIQQECFLDIIKLSKLDKKDKGNTFKYSRKHFNFELNAHQKGFFQFNERKCIVLLKVEGTFKGSLLFKIQVYMGNLLEEEATQLENRGLLTYVTPPINEKNVVKWDWEEEKIIKKEEIEDSELEVMGFK